MVRRSASGEPCCCCRKLDLTNDCTLLPLPVSDGNSRWTDPYIHAARAASPQGMFGSLLSAMLQENCCRMAQCIQGMMFFFCFCCGATGELSTLRQMMKVPNEPGLSPNNGLENAFLSDQSISKSPQGACKTFWRQDDQPRRQGWSCHDTCVSPCKARTTASVTM